jgi:hypothetical protein
MVCAERDGVLHGLSRPASIRYRQPDLRGDELTVGNGKVFTITASDVSSRNRFVQSAMLMANRSTSHGSPKTILPAVERSCPEWGSAADDAPPSMER